MILQNNGGNDAMGIIRKQMATIVGKEFVRKLTRSAISLRQPRLKAVIILVCQAELPEILAGWAT